MRVLGRLRTVALRVCPVTKPAVLLEQRLTGGNGLRRGGHRILDRRLLGLGFLCLTGQADRCDAEVRQRGGCNGSIEESAHDSGIPPSSMCGLRRTILTRPPSRPQPRTPQGPMGSVIVTVVPTAF